MSSENDRPANDVRRVEADVAETRSTSGMIIQGLAATGAAAYGVGSWRKASRS